MNTAGEKQIKRLFTFLRYTDRNKMDNRQKINDILTGCHVRMCKGLKNIDKRTKHTFKNAVYSFLVDCPFFYHSAFSYLILQYSPHSSLCIQ